MDKDQANSMTKHTGRVEVGQILYWFGYVLVTGIEGNLFEFFDIENNNSYPLATNMFEIHYVVASNLFVGELDA